MLTDDDFDTIEVPTGDTSTPPPTRSRVRDQGFGFVPVGKVTSYGYASDEYADSASLGRGKFKVPTGAFDNQLTPDAMAVSPDLERMYGLQPLQRYRVTLDDGTTVERTFADRTMQDSDAARKFGKPLRGRVDFYSPQGVHPMDGRSVTAISPITEDPATNVGDKGGIAPLSDADFESITPPSASKQSAPLQDSDFDSIAPPQAVIPAAPPVSDPNNWTPPLAVQNDLRFTNAKPKVEDLQAAVNTPFFNIPKPENTGVGSGIARGILGTLEGFETPQNAAIATGAAFVPPAVQKLIGAGFGAQMMHAAPDEVSAAMSAKTPGEAAEHWTRALLSFTGGALVGSHSIAGRPAEGGTVAPSEPPAADATEIQPVIPTPDPHPPTEATIPREEVIPTAPEAPSPLDELLGTGEQRARSLENWYGAETPSESQTTGLSPQRFASLFYERSRAAGIVEPQDALFEKALANPNTEITPGLIQSLYDQAKERGIDMSDVAETKQAHRTIDEVHVPPEESEVSPIVKAWAEGLPGADLLGELHKDPIVKIMLREALRTGNRNPNLGSYGELRDIGLVDERGFLTEKGRETLAKAHGFESGKALEEASNGENEPETKPKAVAPIGAEEISFSADTDAPKNVTSIKNAQTDIDRAAMGLTPRDPSTPRTFDDVDRMAGEQMASDPKLPDKIVLAAQDGNRPMTDVEQAVLAKHLVDGRAEYDRSNKAVAEAFNRGDMQARDDALKYRDSVQARNQEVYDALKAQGGRETARSLNSRKMYKQSEWSLESLVAKEVADNGGEPITPEQNAEVVKLHERLQANERELAPKEKAKEEADKKAEEMASHAEKVAEVAAEKPAPVPRKNLVQYLKPKADAARERLRQKRGRMMSGMDPTDLSDYAIIAAEHIANGVTKTAEIGKRLIGEFGEAIRPHIASIIAAAKDEMRKAVKSAGQRTPDEVLGKLKAQIAEGHSIDDLGRYVHELGNAHIRVGIKELDPLVKQLTADVQKVSPGITERRVRELWSGYGDITRPSQEPAAKIARELRAQGQKVAALADVADKQAPKRSGPQRDAPSDEVRRLTQKLKEEMKRQGIETTDPATQQRSAIQSIETRLKNQLKDLTEEFDLGRRVNGKTEAPTSERADLLRSTIERVKASLKAVREAKAMPEEQRANAALRAVQREYDALRKQMESDQWVLAGKKGSPITRPDVVAAKAQLDALREEFKELQAIDDGFQAQQEAKKAAELQKSIAALDERLKSGKIAPEAKTPPNDSVRVEALKAERAAMQRQLAEMRQTAKPRLTDEQRALQAAKRSIVRRSADLADKVARGDFDKPVRVPKYAPDAEITRLRGEQESLKQQYLRGVEERAARKAWESRSGPQRVLDVAKSALHFITAVKIIGHGTVGMITHAGGLLWRPSVATTYWRNFGRQFSMWTRPAIHEALINHMLGHPRYEAWKKAGLAIDPHRVDTDYSMYAKWIGRLGKSGQRGFDALKLARLELAEREWGGLSDAVKSGPDAPEVMKAIADIQNKATGALRGRSDIAMTSGSKLANAVFFAPRLYASRWSRVVIDPLRTAKTFAEMASDKAAGTSKVPTSERVAAIARVKHAAEFTAAIVGGLLLNQAILSATHSNQAVNFKDPTKSDWLKFKVGNKEVVADGGLLDPVRLLGQIVYGDFIRDRDPKMAYREGSRFESAAKHLGLYVRGKFNPTLGMAVDVASGADFAGRPLPWSNEKPKFNDQTKYQLGEWLASQGPIPVSQGTRVAYDQLRQKGLSHLQAMDILKGAATAVAGMTGAHISPDYAAEHAKR